MKPTSSDSGESKDRTTTTSDEEAKIVPLLKEPEQAPVLPGPGFVGEPEPGRSCILCELLAGVLNPVMDRMGVVGPRVPINDALPKPSEIAPDSFYLSACAFCAPLIMQWFMARRQLLEQETHQGITPVRSGILLPGQPGFK